MTKVTRMDIIFKNSKFQKICENYKLAQKNYGLRLSKLLFKRLSEIKAATSLEVLRILPQARCHELRENRKGQLAVDLQHPKRLIFTIANNPKPVKKDGGLDWSKVTAVRIIGIEDYHK